MGIASVRRKDRQGDRLLIREARYRSADAISQLLDKAGADGFKQRGDVYGRRRKSAAREAASWQERSSSTRTRGRTMLPIAVGLKDECRLRIIETKAQRSAMATVPFGAYTVYAW